MELIILDKLVRIGIGIIWVILLFRIFPEYVNWFIETFRELFLDDEHVNTESISERRNVS